MESKLTDNSQVNSNQIKKVDFHIHSHSSFDGSLSISTILDLAENNGVDIISITDHNTMDGVCDFFTEEQKKGYGSYFTAENGVKVIPGVEVTVKHTLKNGNKVRLHLLVYSPKNLNNSVLGDLLKIKNEHDDGADLDLVNFVESHTKYKLTDEMIKDYILQEKQTNPKFRSLSLEHIAKILLKDGQIASETQFIQEYDKKYSRLQLSYISLELEDVVKLAKLSDAITVIAHPAVSLRNSQDWDLLISDAIAMGIDGIESEYCHHSYNDQDVEDFNKLFITAKQENVETAILSGGTDTHDLKKVIGSINGKPLELSNFNLMEAVEEKHKQRTLSSVRENLDEIVSEIDKKRSARICSPMLKKPKVDLKIKKPNNEEIKIFRMGSESGIALPEPTVAELPEKVSGKSIIDKYKNLSADMIKQLTVKRSSFQPKA